MGAIDRHAQAWSAFWAEQEEDAGGCCAKAPEIQRPTRGHWREFARSLAPGSLVLDLGCGDGAAARALVNANDSLRVTGVDFAAIPPSSDPRIDILANCRMEQLPLADGCIDAAVSQFGFEYAMVEHASSELARVTRPGAPISFLVHHSNAGIVADTVSSRQAMMAICGKQTERAFLSGSPAALSQELGRIRGRFPQDRVARQAEDGLWRHITLPWRQRAEIWQAVQAALAPELLMLAELEASAVAPGDVETWLRHLARHFTMQPPATLRMTTGHLLCWKFEGVRRSAVD